MKKNDVLLVLSAFVFSGLFYNQLPGINFPLFSLLVTGLLLLFNPDRITEGRWWLYALCANLAGLAVFVINSGLSGLAFVAAMLVLSSKTCLPQNSTVVNGIFAAYSLMRAPVDILADTWRFYNRKQDSQKGNNRKILFGISISVIFAIIFLFLYRASNPLFNNFVGKIEFKWFSLPWLITTLFGLLVLFGLIKSRRIDLVVALDLDNKKDIRPLAESQTSTPKNTSVIAIPLFVMLNLMLLIMNGLDLVNIYISKALPEGITLSQFVHEAVWSTVFSLAIAALLIAWFFKGELNFAEVGRWIKILVYLWIIQSGLVVVNTIVRNYWYIQEFKLTHLRIGVYVFLFLSLCGLCVTWLKVQNKKNAWWLISSNFHGWFLALVFLSLFNWDNIVTNYNIKNATVAKPLDKKYLLGLSEANLPQLTELHNAGLLTLNEKILFYRKTYRTYKENRFRQWQSYNLRMQQSNRALMDINLNP